MTKAVRLASHFLQHRFNTHHIFEVQAALLNACNLRCLYCKCPLTPTETLTTGQWCTLIKELAAVGTLRIKFQGGEPTLRHDFVELSRTATEAGITTAVVTNGIRIAADPSLLKYLKEIIVSIDSVTPKYHDLQRGEGSHAHALAAVRAAREHGVRVCINMVVSRHTRDEVGEMVAFCRRERIGLHVQPVMLGSLYHNNSGDGLSLGPEGERDLQLELARLRRMGEPLLFSAQSYEQSSTWMREDHRGIPGDGPSHCMAGRFYVHIEANGDLHPCAHHGARFTPKNAVRDGLHAALAHVKTHNCQSCCFVYLNERKALFGLRPHALLNVLANP